MFDQFQIMTTLAFNSKDAFTALIKRFTIIISDYSDSCDLCHCLTFPQCPTKFGNKEGQAMRKEPTNNLRLEEKKTQVLLL